RLVISQAAADTNLPGRSEDTRVSHRAVERDRYRGWGVARVRHKARPDAARDSRRHREGERKDDAARGLRDKIERGRVLGVGERSGVRELEIAHESGDTLLALHVTVRRSEPARPANHAARMTTQRIA